MANIEPDRQAHNNPVTVTISCLKTLRESAGDFLEDWQLEIEILETALIELPGSTTDPEEMEEVCAMLEPLPTQLRTKKYEKDQTGRVMNMLEQRNQERNLWLLWNHLISLTSFSHLSIF